MTELTESAERIDKWLWTVRLFRTRSLATDACRAGSVLIKDLPAKPAREIRAGEVISVRQGLITRVLRVEALPKSRVGPKLVVEFCTDLTPPEELEKARDPALRVQNILAREMGSGRPTKRDRRLLDQLLD